MSGIDRWFGATHARARPVYSYPVPRRKAVKTHFPKKEWYHERFPMEQRCLTHSQLSGELAPNIGTIAGWGSRQLYP
jgi:hypothetical protein